MEQSRVNGRSWALLFARLVLGLIFSWPASGKSSNWVRSSTRHQRPNATAGRYRRTAGILARVLERTQLEDFPEAGHEKDQAQHQPRE